MPRSQLTLAAALAAALLTSAAPQAVARPGDPGLAGWVHVAPGGHFLADAAGRPFFSVGHDECFGGFLQPLHSHDKLDSYLGYMEAHGQNTLLVQVESDGLKDVGDDVDLMTSPKPGPRVSLEYPAGVYSEAIARQFDDLLDMALAHHIYVVTYLWDTFNMDWHWDVSTYNRANGGPCTYVSELVTNPKAIALEKRKFAYAINRWGNRPNLLAWDLMNEIEWAVAGPVPANKDARGRVHGATAQELESWVTMMGAFVRETELKRWGRTHLRTVSTNNPHYAAPWFYRNAEVDVLSNHQYMGPATNDPGTPREAALAVRDGVREALGREGYRRPYLDTESGPLVWDQKTGDVQLYPHDREVFHAMTWANWASGAAGAGMRWPYPYYGYAGDKNLNPLSDAMVGDLGGVARAAQQVDWLHLDPRPADARVHAPGVLAIASGDSHQVLAWLSREAGRQPVPVRVTGLAAGAYDALWLDDTTGEVLRTDSGAGPTLALQAPGFGLGCALVVRPHR